MLFILGQAKNSYSLSLILQMTPRSLKECTGHNQGEFVPNPSDCSKFFYCLEGGKSAEAECPNGMLFNKENKLCDQKSNVQCMTTSNKENGARETAMVERYCATQALQLNGRIEYVSSTSSCRHYFICSLGQVKKEQCPSRLHWNAKAKKCDFPANADCRVDDPGAADWAYSASTGHLINCPPSGQHVFPHMRRCEFFVHCVNGHAILQQCPFFYEFDLVTKTCKLRKIARCVAEFL